MGQQFPQVLDWVAAGQCELGFGQSAVEHATVLCERMPRVRAVAVVPSNHPLAARKRLVPEDFAGEAFIALGAATLMRYSIDAMFAEHGVARTMRVETQLTMIACAMVAAGAGISIVDPFTAQEYAGRGVAIRPFEPAITFEMAVLHSAQRSLSTLAQDFLGGFRDAVATFRLPEQE
ncbi:LysR substrate-binding domain-containing protein [Azospirillum argentinense]|uniref:LysR substrate-binding domain-containing protein n=1 Tax=Azospirillum argentinense TaxID=2970906 RepID=UPI0026AEBB34|nr:LysR substrate-binding domain-containing protein [Azospirillum argentinense]